MTPRSNDALLANRQTLVHNNKDVPELVAVSFVHRWPEMQDEILSLARGALVEAGRTHDPDKAPFRVYAIWRVWCELRSWSTREARHRHPALAAVHQVENDELEGFMQEPANADDIQRSLRDTDEQAKDRAIALGRASAIQKLTAFLIRAELQIQAYPRGGESAMSARQQYRRGFAALAKAFASLPGAKRRIIVLHYVQGQSLRKIAQADGVDTKVIQKAHKDALKHFGSELRAHGVDGAPSIEGRPSGFELRVGGVLGTDESEEPQACVS